MWIILFHSQSCTRGIIEPKFYLVKVTVVVERKGNKVTAVTVVAERKGNKLLLWLKEGSKKVCL